MKTLAIIVLGLIPALTAAAGWPCAQQADVDGDGKPDRVVLGFERAGVQTAKAFIQLPLALPAVRSICLGDLDRDGKAEIVAGVVRATTKDRRMRRRVFVYSASGGLAEPMFFGTEGGGSLLHLGLADLDGDGAAEILAREREGSTERTRVYGWKGYSLVQKPELAPKAPAWSRPGIHATRPWLGGEVSVANLLEPGQLGFERTPGRIRPVRLRGDLAPAVNRGKYRWLNRAARRHLARQGFAVIRTPVAPAEFHSLYIDNQYRGLPSFVTADAALHLTHLLFDHALQIAEGDLLAPALMRLVDDLHARALGVEGSWPGELVAARQRVLLRLEIARLLLNGEPDAIDPARAATVRAVVDSIEKTSGASGDPSGPSSPFSLDYSDFVVRGHYTSDELLSRYFRAYLFLTLAAVGSQAEAALLAVLALSGEDTRKLLSLLSAHTRALSGHSRGRTPLDLISEMKKTFGEQPAFSELIGKSGCRASARSSSTSWPDAARSAPSRCR